MIEATIIWFNALRGYGFAEAPDVEHQILVRARDLAPDIPCLQEGDIIRCTLAPPNLVRPGSIRHYGPQAKAVRRKPGESSSYWELLTQWLGV